MTGMFHATVATGDQLLITLPTMTCACTCRQQIDHTDKDPQLDLGCCDCCCAVEHVAVAQHKAVPPLWGSKSALP